MKNKAAFWILLIGISVGFFFAGFTVGVVSSSNNYNDRCMKYFGYKGYPADGYCKLFIGEIKARDE